jgi:hypothetical protein
LVRLLCWTHAKAFLIQAFMDDSDVIGIAGFDNAMHVYRGDIITGERTIMRNLDDAGAGFGN